MTELTYPTNAELTEIAQDLVPRLTADRPIFDCLPMVEEDAFLLMWEQEDNYVGLQQVRGLNGEPGRVTRVGMKRYQMTPGAYGEFATVDEAELTMRRAFGTFATAVDITDIVMRIQRQLLVRRLDRVEYLGWNALLGTFSVSGPGGSVLHTDTWSPQTFSRAVAWSTPGTSTPLADFRTVKLLQRGHSVDFGTAAKAYMNRKTLNYALANTNAADLYGRRVTGLATVNSLPQVNALFAQDGLPQLVDYDGGYLDDSGTFQPFIPDNKVILVGRRTDAAPIGDYAMVRNANNPGLAPGAYMKVVDHGEDEVPRKIDVHDGHNGGPRIKFPSAVVVLSV